MDQTPESDEVPLPRRSPDGDLALAFLGSIAVGILTPVIPAVVFAWPSSLLVMFAMVGGFFGFFWGYLTVIVAAAVGCEVRRAATLWMFAILSVGVLMISCCFFRGIQDV